MTKETMAVRRIINTTRLTHELGHTDVIEALEYAIKLRAALQISTNGLRHCSRWNISEEKEKAIMTQVIANEALLTHNLNSTTPPVA